MAELKLEGEALQKVLDAAVLQALGETGKDLLIKEVVRYLTTPTGSGFQKVSPLMTALYRAAEVAAQKFIFQKMESDPEFVQAVESLYVDAFKKFTGGETREKTIERMAQRLSKAFDSEY